MMIEHLVSVEVDVVNSAALFFKSHSPFSANIHQRKFISAVPFLISISLSTLSNVRFQLKQPVCHVNCGRGSNSFTKSKNYLVKLRRTRRYICEG